MHTLLKATKANVCANIVVGRSFFASTNGIITALRRSCGTKAKRSNSDDLLAMAEVSELGSHESSRDLGDELRYSSVL